MQPNARDLTYSVYRPDLAALGAKDGFMPSGLPVSVNDPLSRRDFGLEFLDVTSELTTTRTIEDDAQGREVDVYKITNNRPPCPFGVCDSSSIVDTNLLLIVQGLSGQARLVNASGITKSGDPNLVVFLPDGYLEPGPNGGDPYLRVFLPNRSTPSGVAGVLQPGQSIVLKLIFTRQPSAPPVSYTLKFLSGQGNL
jgi:hypothetical protein